MWVEYWGICARKWGREIETSLSRPKRRTNPFRGSNVRGISPISSQYPNPNKTRLGRPPVCCAHVSAGSTDLTSSRGLSLLSPPNLLSASKLPKLSRPDEKRDHHHTGSSGRTSSHVRMERQRSSETMQPGSKVARVEYSESSSGRSSPGSSSPGSSSGGERCHLAPGLEQEARCPAPSSTPRLRSCGVCSQQVGCSQSSIYMAFDQPFCSVDCRERAVLKHFARSLTAFDLPPSSSQRLSAALAG